MANGEAGDGDVDMKPSDPNDLSAYNLETYDEEESRGAGEGSRGSRSFEGIPLIHLLLSLQRWEPSPISRG